jgi:hypothetical protein
VRCLGDDAAASMPMRRGEDGKSLLEDLTVAKASAGMVETGR